MPTDDANSSAAPNAPSGVQRPTIIAARPMNPRPAVMPGWNDGGRLHAQERAAEPGQDAAEQDVPVAQPDDVDADRLGRPRVLADRPAAQAPARSGTAAIWKAMTMTISDDRDRALGEERRRRASRRPAGRSATSGGFHALNWPAPSGELVDSSEIR